MKKQRAAQSAGRSSTVRTRSAAAFDDRQRVAARVSPNDPGSALLTAEPLSDPLKTAERLFRVRLLRPAHVHDQIARAGSYVELAALDAAALVRAGQAVLTDTADLRALMQAAAE